ncbi:endonuclease/exonuclease/phosphatase family protein [Streptomyces nojiriensis]|uniref:endonuclease/exonuclease/phosphatase family protein n=1 Tax=Streptomyces nojiriensis TaxID=66374 RepID=UPI0036B6A55A
MSVVIGTWNLENLCRPLPPGGPPSNRCAAQDETSYQAKLEGLAATIDRLAPDLLGVQEVGSHEALTDLVDRLGGDWHIALSTHPDRRGIRTGFLSRRPLTVVEDRTAFPDHLPPVRVEDDGTMIKRMGRGGLAVRWSPVPGHTVGVAVCHLKSKLLTSPATVTARTTSNCAPATPRTPCTAGPPRPSPCASWPISSCRATAARTR